MMNTPNRPYRKIWEKENPWLTKRMDGDKEVAHCKWCNVDLGCITTRFKEHRKTMKHRKNDPEGTFKKVMKDVDTAVSNSKNLEEDNECTLNDNSQVLRVPATTEVILSKVPVLEDKITPVICVDFSQPVPNDILEVLNISQADIKVDDASQMPVGELVTRCTVKANDQHPQWLQYQLTQCLTAGTGYDLIWKCQDGRFRAHKCVLAAFSQQMQKILPDNEVVATLYTPELSSQTVQTILKILYTGEAKVDGAMLKTINEDFLAVGFHGQDMTAVLVENNEKLEESTQNFIYDDHDNLDDDFSGHQDEVDSPQIVKVDCKREKETIKIELEDEEELNETQPSRKRIKLEDFNTDNALAKVKKKENDMDDDFYGDDSFLDDNDDMYEPENEEKKKTNSHYYRETHITYSVKSKKRNRGVLSKMLPFDLFDDKELAEKVIFITVCPICLNVFPEVKKMRQHRIATHGKALENGQSTRNSMILDRRKMTKFHCKKCLEDFEVKHIVWFVKHYKYCGINDVKANEILRINDVEDDDHMQKKEKTKEEMREDVLVMRDVARHRKMCKLILNKDKICAEIWGCRKCFEAFEFEEELKEHINNAHEGKVEYGTLYDEATKTYSCQKCKVFKTNKNIINFIFHQKRCNVESQSAVPIDDEEDIDEDTFEEFVDPWGIIYKPLKVRNERSKWICESLFGELYEILYPCHICYTVFKQDEALREHFRTEHPGLQNFIEFGQYYNNIDKGFECPVCKRNVCKKDRNTIYFTYHMQKCRGNLHSVVRSCPNCPEKFTSLKMFQMHLQSKCGALSFVCHICGLGLKSKANLRNHVMYFHTTERKYNCNVCESAFKREFDLKLHMRRHMGSLDFSCEKCGKAFPVKKALTKHMKTHLSEAEKPHVCHICGNRFTLKAFLINHLTTHSDFRGFACEVCSVKLKTRDSLSQHRRKVHKLNTRIPESCILKPDDQDQVFLVPGGHQPLSNPQQSINMKYKRGGGGGVVANRTVRKQIGAKMAVHGNNQHVKEEPAITSMLKEELELPFDE